MTVNVKTANHVAWEIASGQRSVRDELILNRPLIVGAGAFRVPALPIAVVYEPPPDRQLSNKATYAIGNIVGTTTRMTFSHEESTTEPGVPGGFLSVTKMQKAMKDTANLAKTAGIPYGNAIAEALGVIDNALGRITVNETTGSVVTEEGVLGLVQMCSRVMETGPNNGGPGVGDNIYFLRNARLVWMAVNGRVSLALLGADGVHVANARPPDLMQNISALNLDSRTAQALAALDPFAARGPMASLPRERFELVETVDMLGTGGAYSAQEEVTVTSADRQARTGFSTHLEDRRAGWLSFLGIGVTETETTKTNVTLSSSTEATSVQTATATLTLNCEADEYFSVAVYFDRIFGTFAVRNAVLAPKALVSGVLVNPELKRVVGQMVYLVSGESVYSTLSDAQGRFAFRSRAIKPGPLWISVGRNVHRDLLLQRGKTLKDVEIRLE